MVSNLTPDARVLDVNTIHPQYEQKINADLQKEIETTQRKYYEGLPKAQKDPGLVDRYMELLDPKNKAGIRLGYVGRSGESLRRTKGYDVIRFSDGEIVVKNPKAIQSAQRRINEVASRRLGTN